MLPFTLEPVLLEMEEWRYTGPILLGLLVDLVAGRLGGVSIGGNIGGSSSGVSIVKGNGAGRSGNNSGTYGGAAKVQVRYDAHHPALSLWDEYKSRTLLEGAVLPTIYGHIICKNCPICGLCVKLACSYLPGYGVNHNQGVEETPVGVT